jgi:hypothetical protein
MIEVLEVNVAKYVMASWTISQSGRSIGTGIERITANEMV